MNFGLTKSWLGAVHKRRPYKIAKIDPLSLVRKMSELAQSPLSVRTHHKFRKNPKFFALKSANVRI